MIAEPDEISVTWLPSTVAPLPSANAPMVKMITTTIETMIESMM